jgi:Asp-tRNA(Asn)/Glu-tRNA(Gln) amidotransferase A subunit family amidase
MLDHMAASSEVRMALPSSRYSRESSTGNILRGVKAVVNDNFMVAGCGASLSNKDWREFSSPSVGESPCITRLRNLGVIILGKTRTSAFMTMEGVYDHLDFAQPRNPRGDRFRTPSWSSSGSGVAMSAYSFIDFAIGSDSELYSRRVIFCLRGMSSG